MELFTIKALKRIKKNSADIASLTNDVNAHKADYANYAEANYAKKTEVTNVMTPKGTIAYASLPVSGNEVGWYYYCPDGDGTNGSGNYVWNGTEWYFGGTGDEGYSKLKSDLRDVDSQLSKSIADISEAIDLEEIKGLNRLDVSKSDVGFIKSDGTTDTQSTYKTSDYIEAKTGDVISLWANASASSTRVGCQNIPKIATYREDKSKITVSPNWAGNQYTISDSECAFVRISYTTTQYNQMVTINWDADIAQSQDYTPYKDDSFDSARLKEIEKDIVENKAESDSRISALESISPIINNIDVCLPKKINTVVGRPIDMYFDNIVNFNSDEIYETWGYSTAQYKVLGDRLHFDVSSVRSQVGTLDFNMNGYRLRRKEITINTVADNIPTIKAMFIGDSMTNQGIYLSELKRMMGDALTLYGTRTINAVDADDNTRSIDMEGRSSWQAHEYCTVASKDGVENPFYHNGFDFSYYMANHSNYADITDVFILLGANDSQANDDNYKTAMQNIVSSVKAYKSSIRIHLMLPIPPEKQGYGFGNSAYTHRQYFKNSVFRKAKWLVDTFDNTSGISIVPTNMCLDCWYDFPRAEVQANSRNPAKMEVATHSVHPSKYGYFRFSDVLYADIIANCQ